MVSLLVAKEMMSNEDVLEEVKTVRRDRGVIGGDRVRHVILAISIFRLHLDSLLASNGQYYMPGTRLHGSRPSGEFEAKKGH